MMEPIVVEEPRLDQARPAFPRIRDVAPSASYPYVDEHGRELFVVCRYQTSERDKTFRQFRLEAGEWVALGDARRVIYRLPQVLEHIARNDPRPIFVVEGEKDVHAIERAGGVATTNPMGAGKWTDDYSDMLQGARNVIIVADRDHDGKRRADTGLTPGEAHAISVQSSLKTVGVPAPIVQARTGKDSFDHLSAGFQLDDFAEWGARASHDQVGEPERAARTASHSWEPVNLLEAAATNTTLPTIGGLVYPGLRHLLLGEPESLKTWLSLVLAVAEIRSGRTVFHIDFESTAREMLSRLRDLGLEDEEIAGHFVYLQPSEPLGSARAAAYLAELVATRQPSLAVVDAMVGALALHGLDPNSAVDIENLHRALFDPLSAHGAAVVILDHVVKNEETRGRWATGSERKIGRADVALRIEVIQPFGRGKTGLARISTSKDRPGHLPRPRAGDLSLYSDPDTGAITSSISLHDPREGEAQESTFRPTVLMEKVSRFLEHLAEPASRNMIEKGIEGKATFVRRAIDTLISEGYVDERRNGRTRLCTLIRPFVLDSSHFVPDEAESHSSLRPPSYRGDERDEDENRQELPWA